MKKLVLCSVFLLFASICFAQKNTTINGIVIDIITGQPVPNVTIKVANSTKGTTTTEKGLYTISLSPKNNTISFSAIGYSTITKTIKHSKGEQTLNIALDHQITELAEVSLRTEDQENLGVNTVSKISLKLRPVNNAQDLLKSVPGLFIAQHAGGGKAEQIFLRGFDNDHGTDFAIYMDDIPVNLSSHAHGQGYADMHFIIPETIGDANYYKGPHETTLGNFAVAGASLYETKSRLNKNLVKLEYAQYDFVRALAMVNILDNKNFLTKNYENAYIAIEGLYNKSFFESQQNLRKLNTFAKYTVDINDTNRFNASVSTFHSNWGASGQIPLRAVKSGLISPFGAIDDKEGGDTKRIHANFKLNSDLSDNLKLKNQVYYLNNNYNLLSNFTFFQNDPVNGDMIQQYENRNVFGYNGKLSLKSKLGDMKSKTDFGLGVQHTLNNISLTNNIGKEVISQVNFLKMKETNYSLYVKEKLNLTNKLTLLTGVRGDYFQFNLNEVFPANEKGSNTAFRLSPKFSMYYDVTKKVQLYAKSSIGFHSNYTNAAIKNRAVNPLPKAVGYDLGSEFKIGKTFIANIAAWYIKSDAEFVFVTDGFEFENKGRSERIGADASFRYQPFPFFWLDTDLNYSYGTLLDEPNNANKIPSAPRFTSTGGATVKLTNGINGAVNYRYMAERPLTEDGAINAQDYFIVDSVINYTTNKFEIGLTLQNIFDQEWVEAVFYDSSQLKTESAPVDDIHFTPGTPFLTKLSFTYFF